MASFQDAFHKGLEAYDSADRARKEIAAVFDDCAKQVSAASGGAIVLSRESTSRVREEAAHAVVLGGFAVRESYQALMARLVSEPNSSGEELCEYKLAYHGYPVAIVYADVDEYCHDKQSLERALVELLGHPTTGGKLRRLMDLHAKRKSGGSREHAQANSDPNGNAE
ncbi:hypothetical protein [Archangium sp.]|uniref:hypothetical protein n=1 Tax=Archangium sp. TaxID=1872627 RepID=UPI002EDB458A